MKSENGGGIVDINTVFEQEKKNTESVHDAKTLLFQKEYEEHNKKTIAFSGHRPKSLPWGINEDDSRCIAFKEQLRSIIEKAVLSGYTRYLSGMALGIDVIAARIVLDLRNKYGHITLECIIPYKAQASTWSAEQQEIYFNILSECDRKHTISTHFHNRVYRARNEYLVQEADLLIAVFHKQRSGTSQTVNLARKAGKPVYIIDPTKIRG